MSLLEVCDQDDNGHNDSNSNEISDHHRNDILGVSPQESRKVGTVESLVKCLMPHGTLGHIHTSHASMITKHQ